MSFMVARAVMFVAAAGAALPAAAVELVSNGGFETGDFTGWTRFGGLGQTNVNAGDAITGAWGARFSPNSVGGIKQSIATTAGTSYLFTFNLAKYANPNPNSVGATVPRNLVDISFDGVSLVSLSDSFAFPTTLYSFTPIASGALTEVKFSFRDNRDGPLNRWSIDNISVTALGRNIGGVPEPATWALLMLGFGVVGYAARRGRRALPAVAA